MEKNEQKIEAGDIVRIKSDSEIFYTAGAVWGIPRRVQIYRHNREGLLVTYEVDEEILVKGNVLVKANG